VPAATVLACSCTLNEAEDGEDDREKEEEKKDPPLLRSVCSCCGQLS
jgi:hypothetical protein